MLEVPIVDVLILYKNPSLGEKYPLVVQNVLYVPLMNHNLIPSFAMREIDIIINDITKIHCKIPTRNDHAIIDKESRMYIILSIKNTFSIFPSRKLTQNDIYDPNILVVTVTLVNRLDPSSSFHQKNECALMDADSDMP